MKEQFLIRYNTNSTSEDDRWRIITNGEEILVSKIHINVSSYTSKNEMPDVGFKFHIVCEGVLSVENNIAEINE